MPDCRDGVSMCFSIVMPQVEKKKPGPTEKLSQIAKCTVRGCLALQHMLCDCAFKATCQEKLVCSGHICQPAGGSVCLTPRLGTQKKRLLTFKSPQG